jgi:hypothetical protein
MMQNKTNKFGGEEEEVEAIRKTFFKHLRIIPSPGCGEYRPDSPVLGEVAISRNSWQT